MKKNELVTIIILLLAFIQTNVIFVHLYIVVVTIVNKSKKW